MTHPSAGIRPSWAQAEARMRILEPRMTELEYAHGRELRVLGASWEAATIGLVWSGVADRYGKRQGKWWPMPGIPCADIYNWLTEALPLVQAMYDSLHLNDHLALAVTSSDTSSAMQAAVDDLTMTWCGRPAPSRLVAKCQNCDKAIFLWGDAWHTSFPESGVIADTNPFGCPRPGGTPGHRPKDRGAPGAPRLDYAPYHEADYQPAGETTYTATCSCGAWSIEEPASYETVGTAFEGHANASIR